jgi:hypothetical protein
MTSKRELRDSVLLLNFETNDLENRLQYTHELLDDSRAEADSYARALWVMLEYFGGSRGIYFGGSSPLSTLLEDLKVVAQQDRVSQALERLGKSNSGTE